MSSAEKLLPAATYSINESSSCSLERGACSFSALVGSGSICRFTPATFATFPPEFATSPFKYFFTFTGRSEPAKGSKGAFGGFGGSVLGAYATFVLGIAVAIAEELN